METVRDFILGGSKITSDGDCSHEIKRRLLLGRKAKTNLHSILKSRDIILPTKVRIVKDMVFPGVIYGCESWTIKKAEWWRIYASEMWCWLEKTLESPLDCKEIKPVNLKRNISWIFVGRTDAEAETPILCSPEVKNWFIGQDPDAGKEWMQKEKGMTEDEMVRWHHQPDGYEFGQAPGVGDDQGSLVCWSPWVTKSCSWLSDRTDLNWTTGWGTLLSRGSPSPPEAGWSLDWKIAGPMCILILISNPTTLSLVT